MASNEIRIPVSAEIQADHKSLLAVQKALENTLALVGKNTTFAANLRKSLAEIEPLIEKFGRIVMEPEIDKNALQELEHIAKKVFGTFDKTVEQGRFLDVSKMLSNEDLVRIQEYTKQVAALGRELEKVRQHGAGGVASEWLAKPEVTKGSDVAARVAKSSTYKPAATLEQNVINFTNAASAAAAKSADLAQRVVELANAYKAAAKATAQAQANLRTLETSVPTIQRRADTASFASAITRIKGTTSAVQNMQINTPIKEIGTTLHQFGDAGYIQASYRNLATRFFQALGMGVEQATSLAASQIDRDIIPALQRHFGIDETNMRSYVVDNGPMLSQLREAGAIFGEILRNELAQARAAGMGNDVEGITDYAKKKQSELVSARSAVKKARTAENEAFEEWSGAEEAQKQAQDLNIELTSLATALREAAAAAKTLKEAQLKADQDAAKKSAADAEDKARERVMAPVKTHVPQAQKDEDAGDKNLGYMRNLLQQGADAKAEANAFKASMQNAIKQWFSVQQIINIVKQGVRQAYQDIQGLDKAMTNIAVVTDMSVSDLWGKINEYMSIAQQYGVTTQGVYEVSQLYYQQGLSTNEVMAATTETLKLARIAGMGYAEAADAMTVAIRSFKMEMSDAAVVTDVYSKVAAITASDSEELAIAMSKTASSAESVGSSFENTTAMLAVMIETTRESAQNLGSALKSIISRYGEMKVGLTVDSEGEEIDYNKVDTALKSVGISIKDAQGQFRDFDEVIFELSAKWDSLDKNTQRYIATIMAGNRQQSRFIALVDNWERLDEVAGAAQDSEDAGLIQYAKTLDSLETKLNNIKTSFQQFYMSIFNGPFVSSILDFINNIIQGFNKLGQWQSILNIVGLIRSIKSIAKLLVSSISPTFNIIIQDFKKAMKEMVEIARRSGRESGQAFSSEMANTNNPKVQQSFFDRRMIGDSSGKIDLNTNSWNGSKAGNIVPIVGQVVGSIASMVGSSVAADNQRAGAVISGLGNVAQGASIGAMAGPWGAIIGGAIGALTSLPAIFEAFDPANILAEKLEKAEETLEQANLERATKREEARNLATTLENLKKLQQARYKSEEAEQAYIEASNAAFEAYPELAATFDEAGNAIIDVIGNASEAEWLLIQARKDAAEATQEAAAAELSRNLAKLEQAKDKVDRYGDYGDQAYPILESSTWYNFDENGDMTTAPTNNVGRLLATLLLIDVFDFSKDADWFQEMLMDTFKFDLSQYEGATQAEAVKTVIDLIRNHPDIFNSFKNSEDNKYGLETNATAEGLIQLITTWLRGQGVIDKNESALDYYGYANTANEEYNQAQIAVNNSMLTVGRGRVGKLLTNIDPLNQADWRNITNAEAFLQESVVTAANLTATDFNNDSTLKTEAINRLDQIFLNTYENYINFANELGYDLDDFNAILASADKNLLSQQGITKEFENLFGTNHNQWSEVVVQYYDFLMQGVSEAQERLKKDLTSNRLFSRWSSYTTDVPAFENVLQELPSAYFAYISDFADSIDKRIKSGGLTQDQAFQVVDTLFNVFDSLNDPTLGLTSEQLGTAYQLISEAMSDGSIFTITGLQGLITTLAGLDIDVDAIGLSDLPIYTINLVTEWGNLQDTLVSNLNIASEAMQKASEGMTLDEALKLAQKTNMDWSNFTFFDGKWYTSNIQAIKAYYEDEQNRIITQLEEEKKRLLGTSDQAGTLDTRLSVEDLNAIKELPLEKFQEEYSIEYGDNLKVWQAIQTYWDPEHYAKEAAKHIGDDSWGMAQYWEEYFNSLGQNVSAATQDALTHYAKQSEKAAKKAERVANLNKTAESQGVVMDKISAYQTIASQGLLGYSTEDIASIAMAMDWQEGIQFELDTTTGTYRIKKEYLSELLAEYQRQAGSVLRAETESALSSIRTLGSSLANGEVGVYADAFIKTLPDAETIIPALIKAGDYEGLKAKIAAELSVRTGEEVAINDPRVVKATNEMVAGYNDGLESNILRYIELKKKELFGTITEAEKLKLDNIVDTNELSDELTGAFTNAGTTAVGKYVAIMKAAIASGANWEDVEQYIKDGYAAQLSQLASGQNFNDLGTYDIMDQVAEAEGQYSQDMLASLLAQIYAETGKEVDMSDFTQYFKIDPETKNWVLKAGVDVNDFFASEYGEAVPAWIIKAFSTSEVQKRVNDAVELDDLGTSATDTIGSIMSDLTNASLSDLVSLYESIYGEGSFADSGLLESYQRELEAAKRGETGALIAILQTLTQAAINKEADVDTTQIQATVKDAHNTLISGLVTSINNGLSGTLSNIDFNNLIEQIGGAPEAYRKYATETYDGLKLSAEGALVIASKLIDKFGNTSLVAESLVEQLGGSSALGSYKDVDDLINEIVNDTNHWAHGNEDILKLLRQMRDEYSQLAEDAQFDFMNQDHFDGAADNWYTFTDNISTAIDKLKTAFEKGGKIDYKSFDNIVTWISNLSVDGLNTQLGNTGKTLGEFTDAVLATVDATGSLDLSTAAVNLGISMEDMAGALENGLQEVAKQQVAYWKNYLKFLKGVKALQEASDEIIVKPPQINMEDGTYSYGGKPGLTADQAYSLWLTDVYKNFEQLTITDYDGKIVQIFSGNNNPLQQLMSFKPELFTIDGEGNVQVKAGMASYVQQYMNQFSTWIQQEFASGDITKYIDQETGTVKIPWNEVMQIELDASVPPAGASNEQEAGEQIQAAAENSVAAVLEASGAPFNGDGSYTYTLDGMTLKIQMGANGTVEIDLANATGAMPTAAELRKVFEGQPGFSATDDNNWVFTDPNLGFSIVCANGAISFDTSGMTAPPIPTGAELSTILGTSWTTTDDGKTYTATLNGVTFVYNSASGSININASSFQLTGGLDATSLSTILGGTWTTTDEGKTYTTNLNGVSFIYNSATGKININASSFQLTGGLDANSLATILGGTWTTEDEGATYTATIAGTSFVYESSSGLVKIDGSRFTLSGGLSATELATILRGTWSSSDGGKTYESTINGVTFTYKSASGTVEIDSSKFTLSAGLSTEQLTALLGGTWSTEDGITYKSVISGVTFTYESTTGTINVDPSGFTVSANLTVDQLKTLLGGTWTSEDGVTYKSTINGVTFTYESATGNINVDPTSFTVSANLTPEQLKTLLGSTWSSKDGITYKSIINGVTFTYESATGNINVDPTSFTVSANLTPEQLKTLLGGSWSSEDNIHYKSTIDGVTFTYESTTGNIDVNPTSFIVSAKLTPEQLKTLLGDSWSSKDGIIYKSTINGVTFTYESTTGNINVDPESFDVFANLTPEQLKTLLGDSWSSEDGITYKSTINGVTFTYESTTGKLVVTPPTTATEPTNADFVTLMQAQGWTHANGVYTKDFGGGTLTYNATAGTLNITPSATMAAANPDMATLLDSAFGAGGWQPNENGGYDILNATTGEVLYTLPAKITITPTADSNVTVGENGLTAPVGVELTPNTGAIDAALAAYEGKTINLTIGISKNSSIKSSQHFEEAAAALFGTSEWDTLLNTKNWSFLDGSNQDLAEEAFGSLVTQAGVLSGANQLTQEDIDLITALGEAMEEAGINVSAAMESLSSLTATEDTTVFTELTSFAEAFGGANLFGNLTALTALLTAMTNPAAVSLDLTGFITQLQSMGELELDDEEINAFVTAVTALTTAITALPTEANVSVKVSAGSSYSVINGIKNALASIKDKTVTITTKHVNSGTPTDANYAGNVSGLALAKGNATDKLLAGAHLAGKTLVGELGPELAVYNNQYHLLGRDGAEFVDLPNDAIVFNHRQTAGIIKGQVGYRGQALVNGNVTGPAAAGGIDTAISAVEKIIKLWSNIADSSLSDLLSGGSGGGGGSGNTIKAVTEELQEWYNLSRQIEHIEQEINNLIAERANLLKSDGAAYLRSLREEQALLRDQITTQEILLQYQQLQLKRQADQINQNDIWSKFLEVDEDGLLQYKNGNEANGGKGALDVLQGLNEMSGEEQIEYLKKIDYSYTTADGEKLEGENLIKQFFQEFQDQIDSYDSLYDTVHQTEEKLQSLATGIEEINQEIKENQIDLQQKIFDILVEVWEAEIEALEKQKGLIEEANEAYINGLQKALQTERDMYSDNERLADRERLQRQLSLLRRSGGSASEIANLEEQLDDTLKDEYFKSQEKMIENIEDANERQVKKLEEQIKLQEEALEYQKENGVIWTKVYEKLSTSAEEILAFMQGNSKEFFSKSALEQEEMLLDWAKKIGIYTEDQQYKVAQEEAEEYWNSEAMWSSGALSSLQGNYEGLSDVVKADMSEYVKSAYSTARMNGATAEEARKTADEAAAEYLGKNTSTKDNQGDLESGNGNSWDGTHWTFSYGEQLYKHYATKDSATKKIDALYEADLARLPPEDQYPVPVTIDDTPETIKEKRKKARMERTIELKRIRSNAISSLKYGEHSKGYSTGGLVDYTGLAMVHGSKSKPESFLNAAQTAQIKEALQATHGKENLLEGLHSTIAELRSLIHNISTINNSINNNITIAPGAVVINVDELANSYDVEELSADIMNRMAAIASKATNRGVSRR